MITDIFCKCDSRSICGNICIWRGAKCVLLKIRFQQLSQYIWWLTVLICKWFAENCRLNTTPLILKLRRKAKAMQSEHLDFDLLW